MQLLAFSFYGNAWRTQRNWRNFWFTTKRQSWLCGIMSHSIFGLCQHGIHQICITLHPEVIYNTQMIMYGVKCKCCANSIKIAFDFSLFFYLGFYIAFNTVQVTSRWVVRRGEETSTYSSSGICIFNCWPTGSNYQLSHLRPSQELNSSLRGGSREFCHSATMAPFWIFKSVNMLKLYKVLQ